MGTVRAVIDVGTNSVKLLVADVEGEIVTPLLEKSEQTRLGHGFYESHILQKEAIEATAEVIASFKQAAGMFHPVCTKVFATSAARDATNREDLIHAIKQVAEMDLIVISGEQEADWVFQGVATDATLRGKSLLVMDLGGGSTEFILGQNGARIFGKSYQLGVVRSLESSVISDPPMPEEFASCRAMIEGTLKSQVYPELRPKLPANAQLVGTGGTATILARIEKRLEDFDREQIEGAIISRASLQSHLQTLWSLPLEKRREIVGLPKKRADVILTGALIYSVVMDLFGFEHFRVSTRGLRFAAAINCGP